MVADGTGCGGAPDASAYGDAGADTLGNLARQLGGLRLPNLGARGLGHLTSIIGVPAVDAPTAAFGVMQEKSAGKDTITGHWEMAGLLTEDPLPTYPNGFPREALAIVRDISGRDVLGNKAASGTAIIDELGPAHLATGALIVYTSADSVLQIAAHETVLPVPQLHDVCARLRTALDPWRIGRVIARPFVGVPGAFVRTYDRRDWPLPPNGTTLLDALLAAQLPVVGVGKIFDIFAGRGLSRSLHSEGNDDGMRLTLDALRALDRGLLFVNLVDFDMLYGHRNDVAGFAGALERLDAWWPALEAELRPGDVAFLTADHGNDPTKVGTDHTRERVPLLACGPTVRAGSLGVRQSFADLGQTIAAGFGLPALAHGTSFLEMLQP